MIRIFLRKIATARNLLLQRVRSPAQREIVSRAIAPFLPRGRFDNAGAAIAATLSEDGFIMLSGISLDKLKRIRDALEERPCFDAWRPQRGIFKLEDAPADSNTVHIKDVSSIPEAIEIANNPLILSAVTAYLKCKPTIDDVVAWWSLPDRPAPYEEQFFHRDQDSIRFLKLFVYLSDVGEEDGPHVFIRGSHRSNALIRRGQRFSDAEVSLATPDDSVVRFTGPFGTAFLEDTFGLHKGSVPTAGTRLVLQVRYTMLPSAFVSRSPSAISVDASYDRYSNRFVLAGGV